MYASVLLVGLTLLLPSSSLGQNPVSPIEPIAPIAPAQPIAPIQPIAPVQPPHTERPKAPVPLARRYPTPDKIPPMDPAFLKGLDLTRVPRIPVRKAPEGGGSPTCPPGGAGPGECWWTCDKCLGPQDISACPENNQWGLTYDDGPSPNSTMLLDHMQSHRIQATVFVVGSRVIEYPAILRREYAQGHDIAMHGWSHTAWTSLTNEQLVAELQWTARAIKEVIGVTPTYVRPPYGDIDNRIRGVLDALGYRAVIWSHDTNDWYLNYGNPTNYNPAWVSGNITQWISKAPTATEGIIALEHDLSGEGVRLAIGAIDQMVKAGMKPQSVSQCLGLTDMYRESKASPPPGQPGGVKESAAVPSSTLLFGPAPILLLSLFSIMVL